MQVQVGVEQSWESALVRQEGREGGGEGGRFVPSVSRWALAGLSGGERRRAGRVR